MFRADKACYRAVRSSCQTYTRFADARVGDFEKKTFYSVTAGVMNRKMKQLLAFTGAVKVFFFFFPPSFVFENLFLEQENVSKNFPLETPVETRNG
jgi:hypothetical protein